MLVVVVSMLVLNWVQQKVGLINTTFLWVRASDPWKNMHNKKEGGLSKQGEQKSNPVLLKLKKKSMS